MATKAHVTVGYFRVELYCRKAGSQVKKIPSDPTTLTT